MPIVLLTLRPSPSSCVKKHRQPPFIFSTLETVKLPGELMTLPLMCVDLISRTSSAVSCLRTWT